MKGILRNDGRNLYIILPMDSKSNINISGGPLQYKYRPVEIYIRLAPPTVADEMPRGSEHQIDNRTFHGEVRDSRDGKKTGLRRNTMRFITVSGGRNNRPRLFMV